MKTDIVTIGLGYIGLPTAALMASKGANVLGIDINQSVVDTINQGKIHIIEPDLEQIVSEAVYKGNLKASTEISSADTYLTVVPTPFKANNEPDISFVESATRTIIPLLKKGDLYIIESTSPVGTTEKMKRIIFNERPELIDSIYIAYCPERVLPGNIMHELVNNDRVIGGINRASTEKAISFYSKFVKGKLHSTNARTAEMCKLVENSSRDVQIAFANELSMICDKANIDIWELIDLANKHPRVNILQPGCGVGGHCIAVDPYFIVSKFPNESKIINQAREINNYKALWCYEKIINIIGDYKLKNHFNPQIAILGLTFKPNIDDLRESPAEFIASKLHENYDTNLITVVEPNIKKHKSFNLVSLENAIKNSKLIFVLVGHKEFEGIKTLEKNSFVYSFVK